MHTYVCHVYRAAHVCSYKYTRTYSLRRVYHRVCIRMRDRMVMYVYGAHATVKRATRFSRARCGASDRVGVTAVTGAGTVQSNRSVCDPRRHTLRTPFILVHGPPPPRELSSRRRRPSDPVRPFTRHPSFRPCRRFHPAIRTIPRQQCSLHVLFQYAHASTAAAAVAQTAAALLTSNPARLPAYSRCSNTSTIPYHHPYHSASTFFRPFPQSDPEICTYKRCDTTFKGPERINTPLRTSNGIVSRQILFFFLLQ